MRITIVQGAFLPVPPLMGGAVEKIWFALGKEFARRGHEVVHVSRLCEGLPREEVIEGVRHLRVRGYDAPGSLALLKGLDLLYSLRALRVLPEADVLVTNTFWLPMLVRSKRHGKLYVHAARYPKGQMRFYAHADRLQTVSRPIQEAIEREVPQLASKVRCISNPLSGPVPPLELEGRQKRLLYVGRVHPEKGIALLLDAVALIPEQQLGDWKLVVVGPAESKYGGGGEGYLEELKRRAEKIRDRVTWTGAIFDTECLDAQYRAASLFIYPSLAEKGETFGLAPLEAMAQGCPALVSNLDCFRDFIDEDRNGFVFDHRSANPAQTLAAKLQELISHPERLAQAAVLGHRTAGEFSLEHVAGQYLEDFQSI
ncbi:MAG: glycosyltransferase family 4 protein [Verrucomicrobiota bacterium]